MQVDTNAVVLSITVEEHAELEKSVRAVLDTWDHGTGRERCLLDITVVVLRVLVQDDLSELLERELLARPDLGDIKGVESELGWVGFLRLHCLDVCSPFRVLLSLDLLVKLPLGVVRVLATKTVCLLTSELLLTVLGEEGVLDVHKLALGIHPLESVATVSVLLGETIWSTVVTEEHHTSMVTFGCVGKEIEGGVVVRPEEVVGVAALRADDIGTLDGVAARRRTISIVMTLKMLRTYQKNIG